MKVWIVLGLSYGYHEFERYIGVASSLEAARQLCTNKLLPVVLMGNDEELMNNGVTHYLIFEDEVQVNFNDLRDTEK